MQRNVDIFLNAWDQTGPATQSAAGNLQSFAADAAAANAEIAAASDAGLGVMIADMAILGLQAALAGAAIVAAGALIATAVTATAGAIATAVSAAAEYIVSATTAIADTVTTTVQSMIDGTFDWRGAFKDAAEVVVTALAAAEFALTNWSDVAGYAGLTVIYHITKMANEIEYYIRDVIAPWVEWIFDNAGHLMEQWSNNLRAFLANAWENIKNFMNYVWGLLSGDDSATFEWKSLTDGFEVSMQELPQIAEREIGALEKQLKTDMDALGAKIGEGMQENINKRLGQFQGLFGGTGGAGLFDFLKDKLAGLFSGGADALNLPGFAGAGAGRQTANIVAPELQQSRFETGAVAAAEERRNLEQLQIQREMAKRQEEIANQNKLIKDVVTGNFDNALKNGLKVLLAGYLPK